MKSHGFGPFEDAFLLMLDKTRQTVLAGQSPQNSRFRPDGECAGAYFKLN
jgi:hypothetical protein